MKEILDALFHAYGQAVTLTRGEEKETFSAFVQPLRREKEQEPREATALGWVDQRRWRYIGPGQPAVQDGDKLSCGGENFAVQGAAPVRLGDAILYWHAVLRPWKEGAQ